MTEGLGWHFSDQVMALREELDGLPWWRWRKRRVLRRRARVLVSEAADLGVDLAPLFGMEGRLRLGVGATDTD